MILVSGILGDGMVELMCARLNHMGYDYLFVDESRFPGEFDLSWRVYPDGIAGYISSSKLRVRLEDITGVYARYVNYHDGRAPRRY